MKARPKIFSLLAMFFCMIPFISSAILYWKLDLTSSQFKDMADLTLEAPYVYTLWLLPILAGISLFSIRSWSYVTLMFSQFALFLGPIILKDYAPNIIRAEAASLIYITQFVSLISIIYFLKTKNRKTFFDPTIRWWERSERYHLPLPLSLKSQHLPTVLDATVLNISTSGIFFINNSTRTHEFQNGEKFLANISFQDIELSIPLTVVRKGLFENYPGWGANFDKRGFWSKLYILKLIKEIDKLKKEKAKFHDSKNQEIDIAS